MVGPAVPWEVRTSVHVWNFLGPGILMSCKKKSSEACSRNLLCLLALPLCICVYMCVCVCWCGCKYIFSKYK